VKVATAPVVTAALAGCRVTLGATGPEGELPTLGDPDVTISVAGSVSVEPDEFVNTARNSRPLSVDAAVNEYVREVAPGTSTQCWPPPRETCQRTLCDPLAAAVKLTVLPAATLRPVGWVVTCGAPWAEAGALSVTRTGPAVVLECPSLAVIWKRKLREEERVFLGSVIDIDTVPATHGLVAGRWLTCLVEENRQFVAPATTATSRTWPPAAGSCAGVAVKSPIVALAMRCTRVRAGAIDAAKRAAAAGGVGDALGALAAFTAARAPIASAPAETAASACANCLRSVRSRPHAVVRAVSLCLARCGSFIELIWAEIRSD
jgi:hypothetical protein